MKQKLLPVSVLTKKGNDFEVHLPHVRAVCWRCDGSGTHVNPNVDGGGISPEQFDEDPDFRENYFNGVYDVKCEECDGERVVWVIDWDSLTNKMAERVQRYQDMVARDRAEVEAERRWGC